MEGRTGEMEGDGGWSLVLGRILQGGKRGRERKRGEGKRWLGIGTIEKRGWKTRRTERRDE